MSQRLLLAGLMQHQAVIVDHCVCLIAAVDKRIIAELADSPA
jgi:hypothetical protein